jgi:hypothetical protein
MGRADGNAEPPGRAVTCAMGGHHPFTRRDGPNSTCFVMGQADGNAKPKTGIPPCAIWPCAAFRTREAIPEPSVAGLPSFV